MHRKGGKTLLSHAHFPADSLIAVCHRRQQLFLVKLAGGKLYPQPKYLQVNPVYVVAFVCDAELSLCFNVMYNKPRDTRAERLRVPWKNFACF